MIHLFRKEEDSFENCYNIETRAPLTSEELLRLKRILAHGFVTETITEKSNLNGKERVIEVGPRMNYATPFHTNVSQICGDVLLEKVVRIERSRRSISADKPKFDRMTECIYPDALTSFDSGIVPEPVKLIPLVKDGHEALLLPGLAMDEWDRNFYYNYFAVQNSRNPTNVEIEDLNNANSEHSRHGFFRGQQIHDGVKRSETLLEIVISTLTANPRNSVIAFKDNSSGIRGYDVWTIVPENSGQPSCFVKKKFQYCKGFIEMSYLAFFRNVLPGHFC